MPGMARLMSSIQTPHFGFLIHGDDEPDCGVAFPNGWRHLVLNADSETNGHR